ncbi:GntR family transcriptional regulator [Xylophilus rhododendri]|nr:GntR family transcriptional regulator [Xylophilus rhododendri]
MTATPPEPKLSPLHLQLAAQVVELARGRALPAGSALTELGLAQQLGVSRTPMRAVLGFLAARGVVERDGDGKRTGWRLRRDAAGLAPVELEAPVADADRLFVEIARDRLTEQLPVDVSEADLIRRYGVSRPTVLKVMNRLAEVGQVERKSGRGWTFIPPSYDTATRLESFRFRMLIEPAALLEPGWKLDPAWAQNMRQRHEDMLARPWQDSSAVALFELNAEFHAGLAAASQNRFFQLAVEQQNRLRRFVNLNWKYGRERVEVSCREHLEILERAESGALEVAASLMRLHLQRASALPQEKT